MKFEPNLLATMITTTTYGTWLPGDLRGYVDDGIILPGNPALLAAAQQSMRRQAVYLSPAQQTAIFEALVVAVKEFSYTLHAVSVESWHVHMLVSHGTDRVSAVAGRLKTRMRQAVTRTSAAGRLWTAGYDKRYCFTEHQVEARSDYIRRHHGHRPL